MTSPTRWLGVLGFALGLSCAQRAEYPDHPARFSEKEFIWICIASNLAKYERARSVPGAGLNGRIERAGRDLLEAASRWSREGWLLQPGVWSLHEEYRYAGYEMPLDSCPENGVGGPEPSPVKGIGRDVTHFCAKWPVFLTILSRNADRNTKGFYDSLRKGLVDQLFSRVVDTSEGIRLRNYMDGTNGLYRWRRGKAGRCEGFAPWGASETHLYGALHLLDDPRIRRLYGMAGRIQDRSARNWQAWTPLFLELSEKGGDSAVWIRHRDEAEAFAKQLRNDSSSCGKGAYSHVVGQFPLFYFLSRQGNPILSAAFDSHFERFIDSPPSCWEATEPYMQAHFLLMLSQHLAEGRLDPDRERRAYTMLNRFVQQLERGRLDRRLQELAAANRAWKGELAP